MQRARVEVYRAGNISKETKGNAIWRAVPSIRSNWNLIWSLSRKQLLGQFQKSIGRSLWLILFPLFNVIVWLLMHRAGLFTPGETGIPYTAFIILSMAIWFMFFGGYKSMTTLLLQNSKMLLQIKFPPEVLIAKQVLVHVITFCIPLVLALIVLLIYGVRIDAIGLLLFPFALIPLLLFGAGLGLVFAVLRVLAVDIYNLLDKGVDLLLYVTPVIYGRLVNSEVLRSIIEWNPLTYLVSGPRHLLLHGTIAEPMGYLASSGVAIGLFLLALRFFQIAQPRSLEKLAV